MVERDLVRPKHGPHLVSGYTVHCRIHVWSATPVAFISVYQLVFFTFCVQILYSTDYFCFTCRFSW